MSLFAYLRRLKKPIIYLGLIGTIITTFCTVGQKENYLGIFSAGILVVCILLILIADFIALRSSQGRSQSPQESLLLSRCNEIIVKSGVSSVTVPLTKDGIGKLNTMLKQTLCQSPTSLKIIIDLSAHRKPSDTATNANGLTQG